MRLARFLLAILAFVSLSAFAQDNPELIRMFAEDQGARRAEEIDWAVLNQQDAERREAVMSILQAGGVRTAQDYYNAAMIFQHGDSQDDIRMAHSFATIASSLRNNSATNWLKAATWDRLMLRFDQPQWYGTQYVRDEADRWALYSVAPGAVTDEQRAAWSVPSLDEAEGRVELMNGATN